MLIIYYSSKLIFFDLAFALIPFYISGNSGVNANPKPIPNIIMNMQKYTLFKVEVYPGSTEHPNSEIIIVINP